MFREGSGAGCLEEEEDTLDVARRRIDLVVLVVAVVAKLHLVVVVGAWSVGCCSLVVSFMVTHSMFPVSFCNLVQDGAHTNQKIRGHNSKEGEAKQNIEFHSAVTELEIPYIIAFEICFPRTYTVPMVNL